MSIIPSGKGHSFHATDIELLKKDALYLKTKKLLYPELSEKQTKKQGKR